MTSTPGGATGNQGAAETPMSDHVASFWHLLETENVHILINIKRELSSVSYWDGASYPDDVAKALVADRKSSPDSKREAYRKAPEDAQERLANISSGRCPNAPPGTGGPVAFREWATGYADIGYSVVRKALAAGG
jgi:hypothetical protein